MGSLKRYKREKSILIVSFLAIPLFLLLLFTFYPIAVMLFNSFTQWNGLSSPEGFVGFDNYIRIFTTEKYRMVFNNVVYYLFAGLIQQILALYFATLLSKRIWGGSFFKGVIFFPFIMNTVAVTFIFQMFFEINGGFDSIMASMGVASGLKWIADPKLVKFTLAFIYLWKNIGYSFVIYLGSMQSIPSDYYEAASIDGANAWQAFWAITFPGMKSIIGLLTTFAIVGSVAVFDIPYILTRGTNGTNTFTTTLIETAFQYNLYGVACAMAVLLMIFVAVVMLFKNRVFKEED